MTFPRICLSLYGATETICSAIRNHQADLYELRLDLCEKEPDGAKIRAATTKPLLIAAHGRPDLLEKYWPFADFVDVEQDCDRSGQNVIASIHARDEDPDKLWNLLQGERITKIVLETADYQKISQLIGLNRKHQPRAICFAEGETGSFSRIVSVLKGARWIYASLPDHPTAKGQFTFDELTNIYRLHRFDLAQSISIFGIIGDPVAHSRSPEIQNHFFADAPLPWIYLPFPCKDLQSLLDHAAQWNSKGFSITHPYKEAVLPYLSSVSDAVRQAGSCNTIARINEQWIGTNTDLPGIRAMLESVPLSGARIVILGAGASARAIASIIRPHASNLVILNRDPTRAQMLAAKFQAQAGSLQDLLKHDYDILIQATSLGWRSGETPVPMSHLRPNRIVIDAIYQDTALLRKARELGCTTINGEPWFQVQASAQLEWWKSLNL